METRRSGRENSAGQLSLAILGVGLTVLIACSGPGPEKASSRVKNRPASEVQSGNQDGPARLLDATFTIEGRKIRLTGGRHEEPAAPGSAAIAVTRVVGNPAFGDLDGDGREDAALFLSRSGGGSGTFSYVAAALLRDGSYQGTNAVLLGDRIAPRTLEIRNGVITAGYDDRRPGEPMAAAPTAAREMHLVVTDGTLREIKAP